MIKIMRASAGSGKTFNLAKTYIRLLLEGGERFSYRHILAVTFTNKATDEMKRRILKELHILAKTPESSPYCQELLRSTGWTVGMLRSHAEVALCDILHDYGAFAVSTIDRFFQQTLRAFSREIGQFSSYQVELDKMSLVDESVDRVLDSLSESRPELLEWLTRGVMEDINEGGRYNLDGRLRGVARSLKSDEHRAAVEEFRVDEAKAYSGPNLDATKKELERLLTTFRKDVERAAKALVEAAAGLGLPKEGFSGRVFDSIYAIALDGPGVEIKYPSDTVFKRCYDFGSWFRKAERSKYAFAEPRLLPLLRDYCALFGKPYEVFLTAEKIVGNLAELRIAADLYREFDALLKEKNVLSLDDSNLILRRIIDGTDAPFIYEKLGVRFEHFLLDEFQDTSRIQWDNFRPLLRESDSKGCENLLVGDIKQSIYRWRGSDWKLMGGQVQEDFPGCSVQTLDSNFRSLKNIVEFNNGFFSFAAAQLDEFLADPDGDSVSGIYSDSDQMVRVSDKSEGRVEALFCDEEDELGLVLGTVERVRACGAEYGDITVLVRNNAQGALVAAFLMDNGISVISDDSLHLKSSILVRQLVSLLSSVCDEEDTIGSFLAGELGIDVGSIAGLSIPDTCEHILRQLRTRNEDFFEKQAHYAQAFMDIAQDYVSIHGNSLDGFLKAWEGSDPKISSPSDPESVRVMTIHKSKGLEFPWVIFPFSERTQLFRIGTHWAHPQTEGSTLEGLLDGVYNVSFSKPRNDRSLFKSSSAKEVRFQFIDNINTYYVALTRAVKGLTVISKTPSQKTLDAVSCGSACEANNFSDLLYYYIQTNKERLGFSTGPWAADEEAGEGMEALPDEEAAKVALQVEAFVKGEMYDFGRLERTPSAASTISCTYPSYALNPYSAEGEEAEQRGRLRFSAEAMDFFRDEAKAALNARMNGTVMHDLLSWVLTPADLGSAVARALEAGDLDAEAAQRCLDILARRLASHPEWFPGSGARVFTETSLLDTDGKEYRPDRVVVREGSVQIIDYKFGEKDPRYRRQLSRYAGIYRRMGFEDVAAYIWYVIPDEVEKI